MPHHLLRRKRGMDAVNEELLQETDYPGADKTYNSPFAAKGTEYDPTHMGSARKEPPRVSRALEFGRALQTVEKDLERAERFSPDNTTKQMIWTLLDQVRRYQMGGFRTAAVRGVKVDYIKLADAVIQALDLLSRVAPKGSELASAAEDYADGLGEAVKGAQAGARRTARFRGSRKRAEIEMHEDPKFLPPRNDMRSHLDKDVKDEIEDDLEAGV